MSDLKQIEADVKQIKSDVRYIKNMLEDLTLRSGGSEKAKQALTSQMSMLKGMFSNLPGMPPELKDKLNKIFDQAGGGI